jgi:hypothetical protein
MVPGLRSTPGATTIVRPAIGVDEGFGARESFGGIGMSSTLPVVVCPGCKVEMTVLSSDPIPLTGHLQEVTYRCPQCGTETKRRYRIETPARRAV